MSARGDGRQRAAHRLELEHLGLRRLLRHAHDACLDAAGVARRGEPAAHVAADPRVREHRHAEDSEEEEDLHRQPACLAAVQRAEKTVNLVAGAARGVGLETHDVAGVRIHVDEGARIAVRRVAIERLHLDGVAGLARELDLDVARRGNDLQRARHERLRGKHRPGRGDGGLARGDR